MALKVEFALEQALRDALAAIKTAESQRSLVAIIKDETLKLQGAAVPLTPNLANDLAATRKLIADSGVEACFIFVRLEGRGFTQVSLVPETIKPAIKMVYASSASHLRSESHLAVAGETHISKLDELVASLFDIVAEEDKEQLMTEHEKTTKEVDKLIAEDLKKGAPVRAPLAGVAMPFDEAADAATERFVEGKSEALIYTVGTKNILVEREFPAGASKADVIGALPEAEPRFVLFRWAADKDVLVYLCPGACKPKLKMGYSSSKGSLVAQLAHKDIKLAKSCETDEAKEIETFVNDALTAEKLEDAEQIKAKPAAKGFRLPTA